MKSFSRRDVLKLGAAGLGSLLVPDSVLNITLASEVVTGSQEIPGAAATPPLKQTSIIPQLGCLVGFYRQYLNESIYSRADARWDFGSIKSLEELSRAIEKGWEPRWAKLEASLDDNVRHYQKEMGWKPALYFLHDTPRLYVKFPKHEADLLKRHNIIPGYYAHLVVGVNGALTMQLRDIAQGKHDATIQRHAASAAEWGQKNGEFFVTTMHEPNLTYQVYQWDNQKSWSAEHFNDAWRHIHGIFAKEGANQWARWFIEFYAHERFDKLNPGPQYVDMVGLSVQNWVMNRRMYPYAQFKEIVDKPLKFVRENYPGKPIGITEVSTNSNERDQPQWVLNMLQTVKENPDIKLVVYMDNKWMGEDHTMSPAALKAYGNAVTKDPYWILAR